jgi:chromosomal replication initiation ATPase DnaA
MTQFLFKFGKKINYSADDYVVSKANNDIYSYMNNWCNIASNNVTNKYAKCMLIKGEKRSGKTHLCTIFARNNFAKFISKSNLKNDNLIDLVNSRDCFIIDDFNLVKKHQQEIYSLINLIVEKNKTLIITIENNSLSSITLPDLLSRLNAFHIETLDKPDDLLCNAILTKNFIDRQLKVNQDVIDYLLARIERSYESLAKIIEIIDLKSMQMKREVTIPLVKEILENYDNEI